MTMNFEHVATRIPYNCQMLLSDKILWTLGFENYVTTRIMNRFEMTYIDFDFIGVKHG